ncbi:MAG: hypothetical protein IT378_05665, partial [Sandaracinaceae bacterium]|nr:hypothetical protein [Sandaracinaceae bacterium]
MGIDIARSKLVKPHGDGGGVEWVLRQFDLSVGEAPAHARIGAIVDRDLQDNDNADLVAQRLREIAVRAGASVDGSIVGGRFGIWMWPDNTNLGALEDFVASIIPPSSALMYADEVCRVAREQHGAEHRAADHRKAQLKGVQITPRQPAAERDAHEQS